jgi:hypothetical protein
LLRVCSTPALPPCAQAVAGRNAGKPAQPAPAAINFMMFLLLVIDKYYFYLEIPAAGLAG